MPAREKTGTKVAEEKTRATPLLPSAPARVRSQPVTVVPIWEPRSKVMLCATFIIPALTNPTTITVAAEEDWIMAVTKMPRNRPLTGLEESLPRKLSILFPASPLSPPPMTDMPKRKKARPPNRVITSNIVIHKPLVQRNLRFSPSISYHKSAKKERG